VLLWLMNELAAPFYTGAFIVRTAALTLVVAIAVTAFFVLALVFGAADWREIKSRLSRRFVARGSKA
jgi:hypothetical protein